MPQPPTDLITARLQARLEAFESSPNGVVPSPLRRPAHVEAEPLVALASVAQVDDLNGQLELIRERLDASLDEVERRLVAAETRAQRAELRAATADAHAEHVVAAITQLCGDLRAVAGHGLPEIQAVLRDAVDRLQKRMSTVNP